MRIILHICWVLILVHYLSLALFDEGCFCAFRSIQFCRNHSLRAEEMAALAGGHTEIVALLRDATQVAKADN